MASHIRTTCNLAISQLNNIVWTKGKDGKVEKHKRIIESVPNTLTHTKNSPKTMDISYVGNGDTQTLERIGYIIGRLSEFREIIPYADAETQQLFKQALDLASLEIVRKEENK
jgi:hypothetical protein